MWIVRRLVRERFLLKAANIINHREPYRQQKEQPQSD